MPNRIVMRSTSSRLPQDETAIGAAPADAGLEGRTIAQRTDRNRLVKTACSKVRFDARDEGRQRQRVKEARPPLR